MDLSKKAEILSNLTGSDFESTYLGLQRSALYSNTGPGQDSVTLPGRIDVKDILEEARRARISDVSTLNEISRQTGRSFESLLMESKQVDMKPLRSDMPPLYRHRPQAGFTKSSLDGGQTLPPGFSTREISEKPFTAMQVPALHDVDPGSELRRMVLDHATSGGRDERRLRREALEKLGERGCHRELVSIVRELMTSGDSDARETRRTALRMVGPAAREELIALIMDYVISGDSDARETRRATIEKLAEFGSGQELMGIVEKLVTSGDSDARETRRAAIESLKSDSAGCLLSLILNYSTSSDSDARETRRAALAKLGAFGCKSELLQIAKSLASSGDSDAREVMRMALELL